MVSQAFQCLTVDGMKLVTNLYAAVPRGHTAGGYLTNLGGKRDVRQSQGNSEKQRGSMTSPAESCIVVYLTIRQRA